MTADSAIDPALADALSDVIDPELRIPIVQLGMVESAALQDGMARAHIKLTVVGCPAADRIERDVITALERVAGAGNASVSVGVMTPDERANLTDQLRGPRKRVNQFGADSLTRVVAVASGKGGVGKSTIAVNLAVAMANRGLRVGIIDADVHGFSVPGQLGLEGSVPTRIDDMIVPPVAFGVKTISIGMFVGANESVAWRGPILHRTLTQFLTDVYFGDLDVLVVDLPPGTGDIAISAGQLLPKAEVVVVTTPQPAASTVAVRAGRLAHKLGQRVVGVVENLAWLDVAGERLHPFGSGGGRAAADALTAELGYEVPLLAELPLEEAVRVGADIGEPIVATTPNNPVAVQLTNLADAIAHRPRGIAGTALPIRPA